MKIQNLVYDHLETFSQGHFYFWPCVFVPTLLLLFLLSDPDIINIQDHFHVYKKNLHGVSCWVCWSIPLILALGRQRQSQPGYIVRLVSKNKTGPRSFTKPDNWNSVLKFHVGGEIDFYRLFWSPYLHCGMHHHP